MESVVRQIIREELGKLKTTVNSINPNAIEELTTLDELVESLQKMYKAIHGSLPQHVYVQYNGVGGGTSIRNRNLFEDIVELVAYNEELTGKRQVEVPITEKAVVSIKIGDETSHFSITP